MDKKQNLRDRIVVMTRSGDRLSFGLVVLQVIKKDLDGPREFRILHHDESIKIEGGEEFVTAYIPFESLSEADK